MSGAKKPAVPGALHLGKPVGAKGTVKYLIEPLPDDGYAAKANITYKEARMAKSRRGFAAMSKEERTRISRLGGKASGARRSNRSNQS